AYGLFSKTFSETRLTAGYFKGRDSLLGGDDAGLLLGVDRPLNDKWWIAADYQEGKSAFGATGLGVAYAFAPNASVILGFVRFNDRSLQDMITTQIDVDF
ncbi:MAG: hypothetical protein GTN65_02625, partial [Armatimonadetes bacterium]|nr:hypothetical protein [Armatimonadota bacterium]NIO96001.1 hypothetical protein [Armatimonadota bacterium]